MTKTVASHPGSGRPGAQKGATAPRTSSAGEAVPAVQPKRMKVFFSDVNSLVAKRETYERRLKSLDGPQNKRKRANCYKVIMQINRAIKHGDKCIKSPEELKRKRIQDRVKRIAKKLDKKRQLTLKRQVRDAENTYHQ